VVGIHASRAGHRSATLRVESVVAKLPDRMGSDREQRCFVGVVTVDDQAVFRGVAREVIEATAGFELLGEAASGEEAIELADRVDPDLVLVDLRMPGMDGLETCRRLRATHPSATVVLVSTDEPDDMSPGACGAAAFLPKRLFGRVALKRLWDEHGGGRTLAAGGLP
jgi:two-component system, NarL family, invasion response regulator UvrY